MEKEAEGEEEVKAGDVTFESAYTDVEGDTFMDAADDMEVDEDDFDNLPSFSLPTPRPANAAPSTIPQQLQQQQPALPAKIILSDEVIRATLSTSPKPATKTQSSVSEVVEETPRPVLASSRLAPTAFSKQSPPPQPQLPTKPSIAPSWASKKPPQASDADSSDDDRRQPPIQPPVTRPSVTLSSKLRSPPESFSMVPRKDVAKNNKENFVHPLGGS
ncbi:hypothetical protein BC829DRAFT_253352 [Chytridium lagenaria]|nr:hypothetical protein BC829DRAFT_253352 [Chytridium lagenaria]